jgi:DNA-binding transcriptional MerR regulator
MTTFGRPDPDRGLLGISVAAELTGVAPQTLRLYETKGLLDPNRTEGGTRRYSHRDLERVERIVSLTADGLNLVGISRVLALEAEAHRLQAELAALRAKHRGAAS